MSARLGHDQLLPQFAELRPQGVFDAELVAFGEDARPDFLGVCDRMLHRNNSIRLYSKRRAILERIDFAGAQVPDGFGDEHALFDAVCEWEMEGVVAKRLHELYRPGERAWVKTKNRE